MVTPTFICIYMADRNKDNQREYYQISHIG